MRRPEPPSPTLVQVAERLRRGEDPHVDPDLMRRLNDRFAAHEGWVRALTTRELRGLGPQLAEEVAQDVFATAWAALADYQHASDDAFRAWLASIALNLCRRARIKRRDTLTEDGLMEVDSEAQSAFDALVQEQREALVSEAAAAVLDPEDQELVAWRYVNAYSWDEIAELADLPDRSAVRVALQRCRRRLAKEIRRRLLELGRGTSFLRSA